MGGGDDDGDDDGGGDGGDDDGDDDAGGDDDNDSDDANDDCDNGCKATRFFQLINNFSLFQEHNSPCEHMWLGYNDVSAIL